MLKIPWRRRDVKPLLRLGKLVGKKDGNQRAE
jgi:hypothetical protein